jgi:hypothetical protein
MINLIIFVGWWILSISMLIICFDDELNDKKMRV